MKWMLSFLLFALAGPSAFAVDINAVAPDFSVKAASGKVVRLSDYLGKIVVLEWFNYGCPFVQKHYKSGNMQKLQKEYKKRGVVWLSVLSSAKGKQGYANAKQAEADRKAHEADPTEVLLDANGKVGHLYNAKSTPHMFIVNTKGRLVYQGAIDNKDSAEIEDIAKARNFVSQALDHLLDPATADKPLAEAQTESYGCNIKYKN